MKLLFASILFMCIHTTSYTQVSAYFTFDDTICVGDCINFTDSSSGNIVTYAWVFQGSDSTVSQLANPKKICFKVPGDYEITLGIMGSLGETSTYSDSIHVGEYPDSIFAFSDTTIDMGGAAYVYAEGFPAGGILSWSSTQDFSCSEPPICLGIYATPYYTADYYATYTNFDQCSIMDTVTVTVKYVDVIDVPNTFSPDENGINDKVYVKGPGIVSMTFRIFDRYGRKVYETSSQNEGWDGTLGGKRINPGTFMWTLDYTLIDGTANVKSGTITLIK